MAAHTRGWHQHVHAPAGFGCVAGGEGVVDGDRAGESFSVSEGAVSEAVSGCGRDRVSR